MKIKSNRFNDLEVIRQYLLKNSKYLSDKYMSFATSNIENFYYQIPCLTKNEITDNLNFYLDKNFLSLFDGDITQFLLNVEDLSENHDKKIKDKFDCVWTIETTSGSTGRPLPIIKSTIERLKESRYLFNCRKQHYKNANLNNGLLLIHKVNDCLKKIDYREDDSQFQKVVDFMVESNPKWIFSSTRILNRFIDYIVYNNLQKSFSNLEIKFIETTSQKMLEEEKKIVQNVFNCEIVSNYGCREVWNIAYECSNHHLHINDELLIVDVVDDDGNVILEDGRVGDIVITSLVHKTMPLIKYYIGDRGRIYRNPGLCKVDKPILVLEEGREYEKIQGTDYYGTTIFRKVLRTLHFHYKIDDIINIRIIQDEDTMIVYLNKSKEHDVIFEKLLETIFYEQINHRKTFDFIFKYYFPFNDANLLYKEKIFSSKETNI